MIARNEVLHGSDKIVKKREMNADFSLKSILKAFDPSQSFSMLDIDDGFLANKNYHDFLNDLY